MPEKHSRRGRSRQELSEREKEWALRKESLMRKMALASYVAAGGEVALLNKADENSVQRMVLANQTPSLFSPISGSTKAV